MNKGIAYYMMGLHLSLVTVYVLLYMNPDKGRPIHLVIAVVWSLLVVVDWLNYRMAKKRTR